ncbi:MAG: hypothetical protein HC821_00185 [Lewinella sp.]|nr:hypothetical protein [Lewinella sp.]
MAEPARGAEAVFASASPNPAATGFNVVGSDARALAIADSIVLAHGGRRVYDQTRFFHWNFFGLRTLTWDKREHRVRIDFPAKETVYLLDSYLSPPSGRVKIKGQEITQPDSLKKYLAEGRSIWINDSYWLVHHFKLKDSGVTLKYAAAVAADPLLGRPSYILDQTFAAVGDTPQNRYRLYIDQQNFRINTWQFFRNIADKEPEIQTIWAGYANYNGLLLSTDRGLKFQFSDVSVPAVVEDEVFVNF